MKTKLLLVAFAISVTLLDGFAQLAHVDVNETPFVDHELLLMLQAHEEPQQAIQELKKQVDFEVIGIPSPSAKIYHLRVDGNNWTKALGALRLFRSVKAVQLNHRVEERNTTPNDPNYNQQWHHNQVEDHDIDSDEAWDITTGGTAANGARIVVAVLEGGGSNYNHPDLIDNHWTNDSEIPGNGIDDDNNGYVDDFNGWNSGDNSDNIAAGGHGTSVSGMIGATGNNNTGGAGVNWDVEIMQVDMGSGLSESNVIAAYEYPKVMRDLFNGSNGTSGAFVVATNASWGIDQANPANYPVWCAYYDALGASGILNCGATTNSALNVDVVGDMPTACGSDYMVSVTATNNSDVRTFSGYGVTTIDLGAPGDQVYLPSGSSGYGFTSGTSFASPCVAGAIGLVYSVPCSDLAALAISDPQGIADLVRSFILDGVDLIPNLANEVATGGRLNVFNSVNLALGACEPLECNLESFAISTDCYYSAAADTVLTTATVEVQFSDALCEVSSACYRDEASTAWICQSSDLWDTPLTNGSTLQLTGLLPNTGYEIYLVADDLESETLTFDTPDCNEVTAGCTDSLACNFDSNAAYDNGSCTYLLPFYDCNGECIVDTDGDGVCDELENAGCSDPNACNFIDSLTMATIAFSFEDTVPILWTVPPVESIHIIIRGARGGGGNGGNGSVLEGDLNVTAGESLQFWLGGMGDSDMGGWNGGGTGGSANSVENAGSGGGGASDIRIAPYGLDDRIVVAAGGGGQGGGNTDAIAGSGGCETGNAGESPFGEGGGGGSQSSGGNGGAPWITSGSAGEPGTLGSGGAGGIDPCYNVGPGGGGGGGYFGGGGGGSDCFASGTLGGGSGGGGSSFYTGNFTCIGSAHIASGSIEISYVLTITDDVCDYSCQCEGDLNGDGFVTVADILILLTGFGCEGPLACEGDANGDGYTNVNDLLVVLGAFGNSCE
jgi:hypothetical protein